MKAFDRDLARGPWRLVPVPSFLADARAGLTFQLVWAAVLGIALLGLCWAAIRIDEGIFSERSALNIWVASLSYLLLAVGQAAVFSRGGFDFSAAPVAVFAALVAIREESPGLGLGVALGFGLAVALLVAVTRLPGWLLTLAAALVVTPAIAEMFPNGPIATLQSLPDWTPKAATALLVLAAVGTFAFGQLGTRPPRGRRWGARLADGFPYLLSAGLAGAAGIYMAHRTGGLTGTYFKLAWIETLAAVLLGGTWLGSGRPNVVGTVLAVVLLRAILYGLIWFGVSLYTHLFLMWAFLGAGVVVSIAAHALRASRDGRARSGPAPAPGAPPPPPYVV
jgi:ribose/xylose/arabinose/galactoside ABC-type transport system permease subunit